MKKAFGLMVTVILLVAVVFSFSACGNANAEKLKKLDELMTQYEGVVAQAQTEMNKLTDYVGKYEIEGFNEKYTQIKTTVETYTTQKDDIMNSYKQNKDTYDAAKLDELITSMQDYITKGTAFVDSLKTLVTEVEGVIATASNGQ